MTVVDHPLRHLAELNIRIAGEFGQSACWMADLLWDAYLTLEFGARNTLMGKNGLITLGESRMLLHDAAWSMTRNSKHLFDCKDLLDGSGRNLVEVFVGKDVLRLQWREVLSVVFSGGIEMTFEKTENPDEQLLELRFANGDCVDVLANGSIETESAAP